MVEFLPTSWYVCYTDWNGNFRQKFESNVLVDWIIFKYIIINSFVTIKLVVTVAKPVSSVPSVYSDMIAGIAEGLYSL